MGPVFKHNHEVSGTILGPVFKHNNKVLGTLLCPVLNIIPNYPGHYWVLFLKINTKFSGQYCVLFFGKNTVNTYCFVSYIPYSANLDPRVWLYLSGAKEGGSQSRHRHAMILFIRYKNGQNAGINKTVPNVTH